jgi:hypothetical protein
LKVAQAVAAQASGKKLSALCRAEAKLRVPLGMRYACVPPEFEPLRAPPIAPAAAPDAEVSSAPEEDDEVVVLPQPLTAAITAKRPAAIEMRRFEFMILTPSFFFLSERLILNRSLLIHFPKNDSICQHRRSQL